MGAMQSVLLNGVEVWADALDKEVHYQRLAQVQRRGALRLASSYRIVSESAVMVIAGVIPVGLLAKERKTILEELRLRMLTHPYRMENLIAE